MASPDWVCVSASNHYHLDPPNLIPKFGWLMISALNRLFELCNQLLKDRFTSGLRRESLPACRKYASFQSATAAGVMPKAGLRQSAPAMPLSHFLLWRAG